MRPGFGRLWAVLAPGLLLLGLLLSGCAAEEPAEPAGPAAIAIRGLVPAFDPQERYYVSRCGRSGPAVTAAVDGGAELKVGKGPFRAGSFRIEDPAEPGRAFTITTDEGEGRRTYGVRCLPADFPAWDYESIRPAQKGLLFVVSFKAAKDARPWVIVFDGEGTPRWWFNPDTRTLWGQVLADGDITWARSFGDGYGQDPRMADEIRSPSGRLLRLVRTQGSITDGHEFKDLGGGRFLLDTYVPEKADLRRFGGPADAAIVSPEIQEVDARGRVLWRWSARGRIGLGETRRWWRNVLSNERRRLQGLPTFDPVHLNSIEPRGEDEVVISARHTDAVYGIDRASGAIRWKLGGTPTRESLRVVGDPAARLLGGQHDVRIAENGSLSVYDNGKDRPRRPRVVFYRLDLEHGVARYVAQLNDPEVTRSHCCGSARELPDGGYLVSWGDNPLVSAFDPQGRLEFRLKLPASTFRAVPAPPGATSIAALDRGMEAMEGGP